MRLGGSAGDLHAPRLAEVPGAVVAVATSGGRDSTALLHATCRAAVPAGIRVLALHVDHALQPASAAWAAQVARQARRWGAEPMVQRLADRSPKGRSVEAWARAQRYAALTDLAQQAGCGLVLLAHHRGDQAETFLLQALRGQGLAGLAAMPGVAERFGISWSRPWLDQPRSVIEAYVRRHRLRVIDDPSNDDRRWTRNALRHEALPVLARAWPAAEAGLAAAAAHCAAADALLAEWWQEVRGTWLRDGALRLDAWGDASLARRRWLLNRWLGEQAGGGVPQSLVERVARECPVRGSARWPGPGGELRAYRGLLRWVAHRSPDAVARADGRDAPSLAVAAAGDATAAGAPVSFTRPGRYPGPYGGCWEVEPAAADGVPPALLQQLCWRPRLGGERYAHAPLATPRSLKLAFQSAGVPAWSRRGPLLFTADGRLLHVPGLGLDGRLRAPPGSPQWSVRWVACAEGNRHTPEGHAGAGCLSG